MSILSDAEVLRLLDRMYDAVADELESEVLDFRLWNDSKGAIKIAVEHAVCFANANANGGVTGHHCVPV